LEGYFKAEIAYQYHLHVPVRDDWPFWEFEQRIEELNDLLEKRKQAEDGNGNKHTDFSGDAGRMMRQAQQHMPKMPGAPKFNMPKLR